MAAPDTAALAPFALPLRREPDAVIADANGQTVLIIDPSRNLDEDAAERIANLVFARLTAAPVREEGGAVDVGREAIWKLVHEVWQLLDEAETDSAGITTPDQERWQAVSDAMDALEALVPDSAGPFWGGFPVNYFWPAPATREEAPAEAGERLLKPAGSKPTRCYCPPGRCDAPVIMGRQAPCLRAQPQAREEAQPVGVSTDDARWLLDNYGPTSPRIERIAAALLSTPPAPEAEKMRSVLADLVSWFTKPVQGERGLVWVIPAGQQGADDAVAAAIAGLQQEGRHHG